MIPILRKASAYARNRYYSTFSERPSIDHPFMEGALMRLRGGYSIESSREDMHCVFEACLSMDYQKAAGMGILPGQVVIDIGAHIGGFSVMAASMGARVYAFEPDPRNLEMLRANIARNGMGDMITVIPCAAGISAGMASMEHSDGNTGGHRSVPDPAGSVEVRTVRSVCDEYGIGRISLIKMDAEGAEYSLLSDPAATCLGIADRIVGEYHLDWRKPGLGYGKVRRMLRGNFGKVGRYAPYYFYGLK